MTPAELEQEVLSAYAVDVLPLETLHRAGFHAGPVPPIGLIPNARAELRQLRRSRSGVAALVSLVAALLLVRALGLFPSTAAVDSPREVPVGAPIAIDEPFPDALDPAPTIEREIRWCDGITCSASCALTAWGIAPRSWDAGGGSCWASMSRRPNRGGRASPVTRTRGGPASPCVGWISSTATPGSSGCGSPVCVAGIWRDGATSARVGRDPRGRPPHRVLQHREPGEPDDADPTITTSAGPTTTSGPQHGRTPRSPASSTATPWRSTSEAERSPFA